MIRTSHDLMTLRSFVWASLPWFSFFNPDQTIWHSVHLPFETTQIGWKFGNAVFRLDTSAKLKQRLVWNRSKENRLQYEQQPVQDQSETSMPMQGQSSPWQNRHARSRIQALILQQVKTFLASLPQCSFLIWHLGTKLEISRTVAFVSRNRKVRSTRKLAVMQACLPFAAAWLFCQLCSHCAGD